MKRLFALALTMLLAGCGASPTPGPTVAPPPTPQWGKPFVEEQKISILEPRIHEIYCDTEPIADWCARLQQDSGVFIIQPIGNNSVYIHSKMKDSAKNRKLARKACRSIAAIARDPATAEPLGIRHFQVWDRTGGAELADCDFPE